MNVYDFDNTIFRGDSTARFLAFCLRRRPIAARHLLGAGLAALKVPLGMADKTRVKERLFGFLRDIPDVDRAVADFWAENNGRIKPWYLAQRRPDDLVISAGPEFLLRPVCPRLIASRVNARTGCYAGKNCDGAEKLRRFRAEYGDAPIEAFYSDSMSDAPMAGAAAQAFFVRGDEVLPWPR